jgi:ABC-type polysaccharide/polyol phosphate export systems, permease component
MITVFKNLYQYRELIAALTWKNIVLRYKQAYLGILWAVLKPIMLMLIFTLVRSFVGIETGDIPYPILTFAHYSRGYSFRSLLQRESVALPPMRP